MVDPEDEGLDRLREAGIPAAAVREAHNRAMDQATCNLVSEARTTYDIGANLGHVINGVYVTVIICYILHLLFGS